MSRGFAGWLVILSLLAGGVLYELKELGRIQTLIARSVIHLMQVDKLSRRVDGGVETVKFSEVSPHDVIVHFTTPEIIKEECNSTAGACWEEKDGWHQVWLPIPRGPIDTQFSCYLYHELLHVELGSWHGKEATSDCHDGDYRGVR